MMIKRKFRKLACLVLGVSLLLPAFAACEETEDAKEELQLSAAAAVVMDMDTENLIYSRDIMETQYPGDLTKLMTVLLLTENYDLNETEAFSEILYELEEGSNRLGLQPGEEITLFDAACAVILGSADDVCNGIAEYVAGSPDAFVGMMNARAQELGCVNTHFSNPHGLSSEDQYTCAYDLALIARAAYENESFRDICGLTEYTIPATNLTGSARSLQSGHQMLQYGSAYYQEWCTGGKESYTSRSLNCIVTFGCSKGKNLVSVVMGVYDEGEAYEETIQLLTYGFDRASAPETETERITQRVTETTAEEPAQTAAEESAQTAEEENSPENAAESEAPALSGTEETSGEELSQENSRNGVLARLTGYLDEGRRIVSDYAQNHFIIIFAVWCVFMFFLLVLIIVLLLRCIRDASIRRKRKMADRVRQIKEAEIEKMTVEELEAELRKRKESDRNP